MIRAFLYYLVHSTRNRFVARVRRLRQPKYLVSALGGMAYLYFFLIRPMASGRPPDALPLDPGAYPLAETGLSFLLLLLALVPWFLPSTGHGLLYNEAEIQFLFCAPLSRRSVLNFRILRTQTGILFGVAVFAVVFGPRLRAHSWTALLLAMWIAYSFDSLYRMGTSLAKLSLKEHGYAGWKRQIWALLLVAAIVWPGTERHALTLTERAAYGTAAALVLPALSMVGVVLENAVALLMPGWVQLGRDERRGIEGSGQRLISMLGTTLVLFVAALPAAVIYLAAYAVGQWFLGAAAIVPSALAASAGLLVEAAGGVAWCGRLFDRLDLSRGQLTES